MEPLRITHPDGTTETLYEPQPKQLEFHERLEPKVLLYGGRGSGKSVALRWEAHIRALTHPGFTYCILRRTFPQLQSSHLMFIQSEMAKLGGTFHATKNTAYYPNGSIGVFSHCDKESDVLNLLSAQFAWMGFDELSTFEWDMFTKLSASARVTTDSQLTAMIRAATNPLGPCAAQINSYFVTKDVDPEEDPEYDPLDWYAIKANLEDNKYVDARQYKKQLSGLAAHVRTAWVDGDFVLENALFSFSPRRRVTGPDGEPVWIDYHITNDLDLPKIISAANIYRAYDHGYAPDPAICLWIAHLGNRYIVIHEQTFQKMIVSDIAAEINAITKNLGVSRVIATYCDPTMDIRTGQDIRTMKDVMEDAGVPLEPSINNREMFASSIHQALGEEAVPDVPRLQIYGDACPYLVKTLPMQRYNPKRPLAMADSLTDHGAVALAYFLMSHSSESRRELLASKPRKWMEKTFEARPVLGRNQVREAH